MRREPLWRYCQAACRFIVVDSIIRLLDCKLNATEPTLRTCERPSRTHRRQVCKRLGTREEREGPESCRNARNGCRAPVRVREENSAMMPSRAKGSPYAQLAPACCAHSVPATDYASRSLRLPPADWGRKA